MPPRPAKYTKISFEMKQMLINYINNGETMLQTCTVLGNLYQYDQVNEYIKITWMLECLFQIFPVVVREQKNINYYRCKCQQSVPLFIASYCCKCKYRNISNNINLFSFNIILKLKPKSQKATTNSTQFYGHKSISYRSH